MARYEIPRPRRSDYTYKTLTGKWFNESAYNSAVSHWQEKKNEFYAAQRSSRGQGRGRTAVQGLATTYGLASAVAGGITDPTQIGDTTQNNHVESSEQRRSDDRSSDIEEGTRDSGSRGKWSGQRP